MKKLWKYTNFKFSLLVNFLKINNIYFLNSQVLFLNNLFGEHYVFSLFRMSGIQVNEPQNNLFLIEIRLYTIVYNQH